MSDGETLRERTARARRIKFDAIEVPTAPVEVAEGRRTNCRVRQHQRPPTQHSDFANTSASVNYHHRTDLYRVLTVDSVTRWLKVHGTSEEWARSLMAGGVDFKVYGTQFFSTLVYVHPASPRKVERAASTLLFGKKNVSASPMSLLRVRLPLAANRYQKNRLVITAFYAEINGLDFQYDTPVNLDAIRFFRAFHQTLLPIERLTTAT